MATKAELELGRKACHAMALDAIKAEQRHEYTRVIDIAVQSLPLLDTAMQYERKYLKIEQPPTPTIRLILEYAPLFFRQHAIDQVAELLKQNKKIERLSGQDLKSSVDRARELLEESAVLWNTLESEDKTLHAANETGGRWSSILEIWQRAGLVVASTKSSPIKWSLRTRFNASVWAKCSECGRVVENRKIHFLSLAKCAGCKTDTNHVILDPGP